ncbi:MAG: alpha-hydroxy-acid oxidizing protein [Treponema sp.]|nr:alpha-hydroxy-acid oxidizing protein [Treponema sp.]
MSNKKCNFCETCNGHGCISQLPGMGGIDENINFILNYDQWQEIPMGQKQSFDAKIRLAPMTGGIENCGYHDEKQFYFDLINHCVNEKVALSIGDGCPDEKLLWGIEAVTNAGKKTAVFIKPYENNKIKQRMGWAESIAEIYGIDTDAFNIITMRNKVHLEKKDESSLRELKALANSKGRPFAIKGIFTDEDIDLVKKIKPDIALVSNHGGRVPQRHGSTAQFLADFHKILLENSGEVWVDGGIRNQDQIQKAFSYGVKEVLIGRPFVSAILKKQKI